jgi:hypothetical protein
MEKVRKKERTEKKKEKKKKKKKKKKNKLLAMEKRVLNQMKQSYIFGILFCSSTSCTCITRAFSFPRV